MVYTRVGDESGLQRLPQLSQLPGALLVVLRPPMPFLAIGTVVSHSLATCTLNTLVGKKRN